MKIYGRYAYQWGIFWSFISAFLWSTTFIGSRYLLGAEKIDPLSLSFIRFFIAGIILFIGACIICPKKLFTLSLKNICALFFLSLAGITGMGIFLLWGLSSTSAMNGSVLLATSPIFIMIMGIFIGEKISGQKVTGIILCLAGSMLVINLITSNGIFFDLSHLKGDILILSSALCWALYSVFGKKTVNELGGYVATTWVIIFGTVEQFIIICFSSNITLPTTGPDWLIVTYIAIFPSAIAFFAYYEALRLIELSLLNTMQYITPICTIFIAIILLNEQVTLLNAIGIALVIAGIIITSGKVPLPKLIKKY